jgi:hypothetical protein
MRSITLLVIVASLLLTAPPAPAQPAPPAEPAPAVVWSADPQLPPSPALKYTLVPPDEDLVPGNAAAMYRSALLLNPPRNLREMNPGRDLLEMSEYLEMRLEEMPVEDVRLHFSEAAMQHLEWAARRDHVEWGWPFREQGLATLLPEMNGVRQLSHMLRLRARIEILEGRHDDAVHTLQTGMALGRDVARDGVLINALVGAGIASATLEQVRELTAAPGAPNLYWALADLRRPMFSMRDAMDVEMAVMRASFPILLQARGEAFSIGQWLRMWDELQRVMPMFAEDSPQLRPNPDDAPFLHRLAAAALTASALPRARQHLADSGMTRQQIDALPAVQVVAIHFADEFRVQSDEFTKWMRLPFALGYPRSAQSVEQFTFALHEQPMNPLLAMLPSVHQAWTRLAQVDRTIAALQTVEAVRAYAAAHEGRLPPTLGDLTETPAPPDPMTGQPFGYEVNGRTFELTAPAIVDRRPDPLRYQVTLRSN